MAELHRNQVGWQAAEPVHVNLATKRDFIAQETQNLSELMNRFAGIKADIDDTAAAADMDLAAREAAAELSKEEPSDNNYDRAKQKFYGKINGALNALPADARNRFLRDNPDYMARQELNMNEIIFEKQQKFTQNKITLTIPKIASRVMAGELPYEQARKEIEKMVANTNNVFADNALYGFDHDVTVANLTNMLMKGRYTDVINYVSRVTAENEKGETGVILDTLSPDERLTFIKTAKQMMEAEAEERQKALNSITTSGGTMDVKSALLDTAYATLDKDDSSAAEFLDALGDVRKTVTLKDGTEVSMADVDPSIRREVKTALLSKAREDDLWRQRAAEATSEVNSIITTYMRSTVDDTNISQQSYVQLLEIQNSHKYEYLPDATKDELDQIIAEQDRRLLAHMDTNDPSVRYYGMYTVGEHINDIIEGAGIGFLAGDAAGAVAGALAGAISGAIPTKEFEGPSGLKSIEQMSVGMSPVQGAKPDKATEILSYLTNMSYAQPEQQMVPIKPTGGGRVPELLSDPQRAYRQATTNIRDNMLVGEKEIKYGTASEFVLNTAAKLLSLKNFSQDGLKELGIENVGKLDIARATNIMLGDMQRNGTYGVILEEIKDKQEAERMTKELFETFLAYASKGTQATDSESVKKAREFAYKELISATKGHGGKAGSFTKTELPVVDEENYFPYANEEGLKKRYKARLEEKAKK